MINCTTSIVPVHEKASGKYYRCTCIYLVPISLHCRVCALVGSAPICSFLRRAGGFGRPWPRHKLPMLPARRLGTRNQGGAPQSSPSSPHPLPPSLLVVGQQHIRVRSDGRRSVQPCEGCQGYYGDVYWGRGISQLAMILFYTFYSAFDVQGC